MTLLRGFGGRIHRSDCKVRGDVYKVIAPDLPAGEVPAFIAARGLEDAACRVCLNSRTTRSPSTNGRER